MSIALSQLVKTSAAQMFRGLTTLLEKGKAAAAETGAPESAYLDARLFPDMHPMKWQVQMITEFVGRGLARLSGKSGDELPDWPYDEDSFDGLLARVKKAQAELDATDDAVLDAATDRIVSLPIGPDQSMDMPGHQYVTMALLPNLHFHVAIAHALLREAGVAVGKRDFMGM